MRPDGDCVGSCMGMYLYLKEVYPEKDVDIYLQNIPDALKVLNKMDEIREEISEDKVYDLFICQDCGDKDRLEFSAPLFESVYTSAPSVSLRMLTSTPLILSCETLAILSKSARINLKIYFTFSLFSSLASPSEENFFIFLSADE